MKNDLYFALMKVLNYDAEERSNLSVIKVFLVEILKSIIFEETP